ncbi:hypothetical protein NZK33_18490 [Cyanobium sp. FGCU-6]|nr:hypothetical protein [Cyanobium sp. FGCU6]
MARDQVLQLRASAEQRQLIDQPRPSNGCKKVNDLHPQNLTCIAKTRITATTPSEITPAELQQLRQLVVLTIGGLS